jgi:protein-S-isoprenylcysteine O-methyltransferase Ste14
VTDIQTSQSRILWPPILYLAAIAISVGLGLLLPLPWISRPLSDILFAAGGLVILAAIGLYVSAISSMRRAGTTVRPDQPATHLVTTGAFGLTRNPIYLANTLVMVGISLLAGNIWFLILAFLAGAATKKLAIEGEEKYLEAHFGKKYRDYAKKVRRWL